MTLSAGLDQSAKESVFDWAVRKKADLAVSYPVENGWVNLRSQLIQFDADQALLQIAYPFMTQQGTPPEIAIGTQLGISFRRGHKKCLFVSPVVLRNRATAEDGDQIDALVLQAPEQVRELQRRAYQRAVIPTDWFVAVKLWEGGLPDEGSVSWPLCSGRVTNISVGGILVEIQADHNPRLRAGDNVGVEITIRPGSPPLFVEGRYRHCVMNGQDRLGLGFQFVGLEHDLPGRSSLIQVADYVRSIRGGGD